MKLAIINLWMFNLFIFASPLAMATGFVNLPQEGFSDSAYMQCNKSGDFGNGKSIKPDHETANDCAVFPANERKSPIAGYRLIASGARMITLPNPDAGADTNVGAILDIVWRNKEKTDCIYGVLIHLNEVTVNGKILEVNDVTRGGFADKEAEVAYYLAGNSAAPRSSEAVFRIGRTHTAVRHAAGDVDLPPITGAPAANTAISKAQAAAPSSNWVTFTTDVNPRDPDGSSYASSSMMYVKAACTADAPIEVADAIRLRTTGQQGEEPFEIRLPGYVSAGAKVNLY